MTDDTRPPARGERAEINTALDEATLFDFGIGERKRLFELLEQRDAQIAAQARAQRAEAALEECYRIARHLQDKGTTPKRAAESVITVVQIALKEAAS